MKPISQLDNFTLDELLVEISERRDLLKKMVGSLYPMIILGEIEKLQERYRELKDQSSSS